MYDYGAVICWGFFPVFLLSMLFLAIVRTMTRAQARTGASIPALINESMEADRLRAAVLGPSSSGNADGPALEVVYDAVGILNRYMVGGETSDEQELLEITTPQAAEEMLGAARAATVMAANGEFGGWTGRSTVQIHDVKPIGGAKFQVRVLFVGPTPARTVESAVIYRDQTWLIAALAREECGECGAPLGPSALRCAYCGAPANAGGFAIVSAVPSNQLPSNARAGVSSLEGTTLEASRSHATRSYRSPGATL